MFEGDRPRYKPRPDYPYYYNRTDLNSARDFAESINLSDAGPLLPPGREKLQFIRKTMAKQEEFLARMDAMGILRRLNEQFLEGSGATGLYYGGSRRPTGSTVSTGVYLKLFPLLPDDKSPYLMISLVGDAKKYLNAQEDYMRDLKLMYVEKFTDETLAKAERNNKLTLLPIDVDPSLDIRKYDSDEWHHVQNATEILAGALLGEKLNKIISGRRVIRKRALQLIGGMAGIAGAYEFVDKIAIPVGKAILENLLINK